MKLCILFCFLIISTSLTAGDSKEISSSAELANWCKEVSLQHFKGQGVKPYDWTNSRWNDADILFVQGSWKIDKVENLVKCTVKKGAAKDSANWELVDK